MRKYIKVYAKWIAILPLIGLCSCSSVALHSDFTNYPSVYAKASDEQLLLNLARLSNDEPVSFLQLAQISSQYSYATSIGYSPAYTVRHTPFSMTGSLMAGRTVTPTFQFLPITGTNFVDAILSPIATDVYLRFYDQGYPADLVARTIIESIQTKYVENYITNFVTNAITVPTTITIIDSASNSVTYVTTLVTTNPIPRPSTKSITKFEFYVNDPKDPTYPKFLEFCNSLRNAQLCHVLIVDSVSSSSIIYSGTKAKLTDMVSAATQPGLTVSCNDTNGKITVKQSETSTQFWPKDLLDKEYSQYERVFDMYTNATNITYDTQASCEKLTNALLLASNIKNGVYKLKTRTFEAVMYTVAKQNSEFRQMAENSRQIANISFTNDAYGACAIITNTVGRGQFKVRPIMTLTYGYGNAAEPPGFSEAVSVNYDKVRYVVGDLKGVIQDRTVFTMISYLFAQTAISTQNLPVQQLIQVQ
jgi:hypothetical protein